VSLLATSDTANATAVYAAVAVMPAVPGRDLLTYRVPAEARAAVRPGMRVLVPIGSRRATGIVVTLAETAPTDVERVRDVETILDTEPILTSEVFALCRWAARYYVTTLGEVLSTAVPGGLRAASRRLVCPIEGIDPGAARKPLEEAILTTLLARGPLTEEQLSRAVGASGVASAVRALGRQALVTIEQVVRPPAARTRFAHLFTLARDLANDEEAPLARRAPSQHALYTKLREAGGTLAASDLTASERTTAAALVRRGLATRRSEESYRNARPTPEPPAAPHELTEAQATAVATVTASTGFGGFLLYGVTGSGKTEVYLRLAANTVAAGRSVLLLVPEIALTHQLVLRVQERFGARAALLHSGLAPGERWDEWRRVLRGEARVVVGTRSAVFAPLDDLGLVIVDEEHDAAYKQDEGLRYQGRDLAIVRAKLADAPVVLGSATPSAETYQQARHGKFSLLTLPDRVAGRSMPTIEIVDRRGEPRLPTAEAGDRLFSQPLLEAMTTALERGEQTLLFLNRRGFAQVLQCLACGEPAGCPSCAVTLTLHKRQRALLCHHCGHTRAADLRCTSCGQGELQALGDGTERVESEVARLFPAARVGRLDRDTIGSKGAHRRVLDAWRRGELDILIGTQMIAKGHDVPGVTVVGVLHADVALNLPDFRAGERAFQLLTQVAGRAGRGDSPGRVIVQTYRPQHHSLVTAAAYDYDGFIERELGLRDEVGYPPFQRLAVLRLEGVNARTTEDAAADLAGRARAVAKAHGGDVPPCVRGPAPAPLERLRGRYRWQVFVSAPTAAPLNAAIRHLLSWWHTPPGRREVRLVVDVDPVSML